MTTRYIIALPSTKLLLAGFSTVDNASKEAIEEAAVAGLDHHTQADLIGKNAFSDAVIMLDVSLSNSGLPEPTDLIDYRVPTEHPEYDEGDLVVDDVRKGGRLAGFEDFRVVGALMIDPPNELNHHDAEDARLVPMSMHSDIERARAELGIDEHFDRPLGQDQIKAFSLSKRMVFLTLDGRLIGIMPAPATRAKLLKFFKTIDADPDDVWAEDVFLSDVHYELVARANGAEVGKPVTVGGRTYQYAYAADHLVRCVEYRQIQPA